jgi:ribA/ribD-fused uncharacterized protein
MKSIRSVNDAIRSIESGEHPKYHFFWGHTPDPHDVITKSCFSQWWESPFEVDGFIFPTAEHYMMGAKARLFGDVDSFEKILKAPHPKQAKDFGRAVIGFNDAIWLENRFDIVIAANDAKFRQNPQLAHFLLSTGERVLVEASPMDRIWGIGLAANDANASSPQHWQGLNLLGFALMEVRDRLRSQTS